jgi:hypothetical protein
MDMDMGMSLDISMAAKPGVRHRDSTFRSLYFTLSPSPSFKRIKLAIIGTRGVPARYGGFETFAENIAPLLAVEHNFDVTVIGDKQNTSENPFEGVIRVLSSKYSKSKNPLLFYWDSLRKASRFAEIIFICGAPGGALAFLARRKSFVVTNPDGLESRRKKWPCWVRALFLGTEQLTVTFSHAIACDSPVVEKHFRGRHRAKNTFVAEYGARENPFVSLSLECLAEELAPERLSPQKYHLVVARFEPENQIHVITEAYAHIKSRLQFPLIVVSNLPDTEYSNSTISSSAEGVSFLGPVFDPRRLAALRCGSASYIHGHSVGGTNPS